MKKPTLLIMAAGMGSRYGGLKQIDPVDGQGHIIMDFSIYDAVRAGFGKVVFVIKKENEADFRARIGNRIERQIPVEYAFQSLSDLPEGYSLPEGRQKPFGTGQAVLSAANCIDGSFAVINADDYYGSQAYRLMYEYLTTHCDDEKYRYAMVGYVLENTLTENGHVARGICVTDENGFLTDIHERTHIERRDGKTAYTEDEGQTWMSLPASSTVSMNFWGFGESMMQELKRGFPAFLEESLQADPLKCEYFLPFAVNELLRAGKATVQVLKTQDRWYGMTYRQDKDMVMQAIRELKAAGCYPEQLWEGVAKSHSD